MKMSQGNFLCSYLKQTKMSFFYFTKSENRFCLGWGGVGTSGTGRMWGRGEYGTNTVHMYATGKMRPVKTVPGMG
jgi:hypothetical protein